MNLPENRKKWVAGVPVCWWKYVSKGCDPQVLGWYQSSLLLDPVLSGYATVPSVEFTRQHNACLAVLTMSVVSGQIGMKTEIEKTLTYTWTTLKYFLMKVKTKWKIILQSS